MKSELHVFEQRELQIAILSDTHAYLDDNIAALIKDADIAIHAGDVMDVHILEKIQPKLKTIAVAGNNDEEGVWCSRTREFVHQLPRSARLQLPGGDIAVEHGHRFGFSHPSHDELRKAYADVRLIVYGHTHRQTVDQAQAPWIVNPGAAGLVRNQGGPRCLLLHAHDDQWRFEVREFAQPELPRLKASA